ncbi:MAG TPA: AAA family ATPase, partial [Chloroflexota bacterium]|nr:AAA family ATPase [Chloroflexota bacterium]
QRSPLSNAPASVAGGRYQLQQLLGEGARKRVYAAHDTRLGRDVALALIKTQGMDAAGRDRLQREASAMARLGDHAHIVQVFDVGDEAGQPYLVCQLMAGGDLEAHLAQAPEHRLPLEEAIAVGQQIAGALDHAHRLGVIHRDLKPGNVWLTQDSSSTNGAAVKLGDFGLAMALDQSRLTQPGLIVGTVAYMAPEQAIGGIVDARADLYALGCMLYELVCGRPPFVGDESVAIITQHLNSPPVKPSWHRSECPPALELLILRLLEKDAAKRSQSAADVRAALAAIDLSPVREPVEAQGRVPLQEAIESHDSPLYQQAFVGREDELRQLERAYDAAVSGQGGLVMVVGEPGIGKTSVVEQLATYAAVRGGRTLVGHCYEEGSLSLPYLPFVESMRSYVCEREPEPLREELGSGAVDVARVVSEIRERIGVEPRPPGGDPEEERWRLLHATTSFLRNAAAVQPMVLVLEDLHWADHGTLELLLHLARSLADARLLVVGTYRDVEVDRGHPLSGALAELRRIVSFNRIALRGLTVDEVHRMMRQIRGQEVPWSRAEAIHRQTEGNPLFVQEVLRYLVEEGLVVREGDRWVRADDGAPDSGIPEGLRDVIGKRLSRLSASCNQVLSVAAVIGRDFGLETLQRVTEMDEDPLYAALEEAVRIGIVQERSQPGAVWYRFAHAFFRQTLYEEMIAPRRLRLHQQVARSLEAQYAARLEEHAPELAEHYAHSTDAADLARAVHYGELAAQRANAVYAYGEAARHLEQALHVQMVLDADDHVRHIDLLLALGEALLPTDQLETIPESVAEPAFNLAVELGDKYRAGAAAVLALEAMAHRAPNPVTYRSEAFQRWSQRADEHTETGSPLRVHAHIHAGMARLFLDGPVPAHVRLREAVREAELLGQNREMYLAAGWAFRHLLAPRDFPTLDRLAVDLTHRTRDAAKSVDVGNSLRYLGSYRLAHGDRAGAESAWMELADLSRTTHDVTLQLVSMETDCIVRFFDGDLQGTLQAIRNRRAASPVEGGFLGVVQARSLLYTGEQGWELDGLLSRSEQSRPYIAVRACLHAHLGQFDMADRLISRFQGIDSPDDESAGMVLLHLLETTTLMGDATRAELLYSKVLPIAHLLMVSESHLACVSRILGNCDRLLGRAEAARQHYARAIEQCTHAQFRPDFTLTRLELSELLLDSYPDERSEALQNLDLAIAQLQEMGMRPALERTIRLKMGLQGVELVSPTTSINAISQTVSIERPSLQPHAAPDGTVTLLFTDIEGSTELTVRLGDQRWLEVLRGHHAVVRQQVQAHGGFEVKCQGDGFMLAFQSARRALDCAIAIQSAVSGAHTDPPIRVRMGLHTGEALKDAENFHGRDVVLAARIADQARGGEILISALLKELLTGRGDLQFDDGREAELKGLSGSQRMYAVAWR